MKNNLTFLILAFPILLSAQNCLNLPDTTFVCGFQTALPTSQFSGSWTYLCGESAGTVVFENINPDSTEIKVSECGEYYFSYNSTDPNCMEIDTVMLYFDDPSYNSTYGSTFGSLEYGDYTCHNGGSECSTGGGPVTITIGGATPPDVAWEFDVTGGCTSTNYSTEIVLPSQDNCQALDIIIYSISSGDTDSIQLTASQEYVLEQYEQIFDSLQSVFLDSLADNGCQLINPACPSICMDNPEMEGDTIVFDTIQTIIPYRVGGNWSLILNDTCLILEDSTVFAYNNFTNLRLIIDPGADYYGPGSISWSLEQEYYNSAGDTIYGGIQGNYDLIAQWKEFFEYDTITSIVQHTIPDLICNGCGGNSFSFSEGLSPDAPNYDCGPIYLSFYYDVCVCYPPYLDAVVSNSINCEMPCTQVDFITDAWGAYFMISGPSGTTNSSSPSFVACEIGNYNVEMITGDGCYEFASFLVIGHFEEFESSLDAEVCEGECYDWNGESYCESGSYQQTFIALSNGCDSVVTLNLLVNPLIEEFDLVTVCPGEDYNGYPPGTYQEILIDQCLVYNLIVEESPFTPPSNEFATVCEGECYFWNGQNICTPGNYSQQMTDINGCDYMANLTLVNEAIPDPSLFVSNEINCVIGNATISVIGGYSSYVWEDGSNSSELTVFSGGAYSVTVVSDNGCEAVASIFVNEDTEVIYENEFINLCNGQCFELDGQEICETGIVHSISNNPNTGCQIVVEYQIIIGEAEEIFQTEFVCPGEDYNGYTQGEYTIESTDDNGCTSTLYLTVNENAVQNTEENLSSCAGECVDWNGMTLCESGTYSNIIEENGCMLSQILHLEVEEFSPFDIMVSNVIDCDNDSALLSVPPQSGVYTWSTGETGNSIIVDSEGEYTVTYFSENNCSYTSFANVESMVENTVLEEILYICPDECIMVNGQEICEEGMYTTVLGEGACTTTFISEVRQMYAEIYPTIIPSLDCNNNQGTLYLGFNAVWCAFLEFTIIYPDGNIVQTTEMPLVNNISQGGTMEVIGYYYSANGSTCETSMTVEIPDSSEDIEIVMSGNPEISCLTGYTQPETNNFEAYEYVWTGPSINATNANEVNPQLTEAGTYNLTVTNPESGCSSSSQFVVQAQMEIEVETGEEAQISCETGFATPQTTAYLDYDYIWTGADISDVNMNEINPILTVPGNYTVLVTNPANSCTGTAEFYVSPPNELSVNAETNATCEGLLDGQISLTQTTGGTEPYLYSIDGDNWQTEAEFTGLESGEYLVQVQDAENCTSEISSSIASLSGLPDINPEITEFTICGTEELMIDASVDDAENLSYIWSTGQTEAILVTSEAGEYELTVSNDCESEVFSYNIETAEEDPNKFIYIPDAFSPNADEYNPTFKGYFGKEVVNYQFRIFDRWGNLIFSSTNPDEGWNGTKKGEKLINGVYIWQMMVSMEGCDQVVQTIDLSGDVLLFR